MLELALLLVLMLPLQGFAAAFSCEPHDSAAAAAPLRRQTSIAGMHPLRCSTTPAELVAARPWWLLLCNGSRLDQSVLKSACRCCSHLPRSFSIVSIARPASSPKSKGATRLL